MKLFKLTVVSVTTLTLSACGGSGGEDPVEDVDFRISDGVLADFEVPTDTQIAELPNEIANTVNAFIGANENEILSPTLPAGEALFVGPWAMGQTDEGDALVGGTMSLNVDFDAGDEFLSGRLDVNHAFDDDGNSLTITSNPLDFWDVDINGVIANGAISGTLSGQFDVDGETVRLGGFIDGSFTGEGATGALGTLEASAQYPDGGEDGFEGLFQLDRQEIE